MRMRSNKGITLVTLVITIVVLLILVVAIVVVRDSGMIKHAQNGERENNGISEPTDVPIPEGFKYVTGTKDSGLVIEHETEGSQFVWVPVTALLSENGYVNETTGYREPDVVTGVSTSETVNSASGRSYDALASNLNRAGCTVDLNEDGVVNVDDFKIQLTKEYKEMVESVNRYGGYYVGRYEVSINNGKAQSKADGRNIISATADEDSANTWYGLYALCKTYNTSTVKSSMIWGSQYDAMITWMGITDSSSVPGYNTSQNPGTEPTDIIKNVYDLYGGSYEWTLETHSTSLRVLRGGSYVNPYLPSESECIYPTFTRNILGSRLAIYIV